MSEESSFNDNLSDDGDYTLDDYRLEQYTSAETSAASIYAPQDQAAIRLYMIERMQEIERVCHILDMLLIGEQFTTSESESVSVTFTRKQ